MGEILDAPNQQAVGVAPPWTVDNQGNEPAAPKAGPKATEAPGLDDMTKAELLDHAREIGASPANHDMTKDELRASIDAKQAEGG